MIHLITFREVALLAFVVGGCSSSVTPRGPGTTAWDMTAAGHCDMAHQYAQLSTALEREAAALAPGQQGTAQAATRAQLRQWAYRDRQIAKMHAQAANRVLEERVLESWDRPCTVPEVVEDSPTS